MLSRGSGTGGILYTPGAVEKRKEKPPAANADPAVELLRSLSILGRAPVADSRGRREVTHMHRCHIGGMG
ncbi:MAG: hypothetical protein PVSMB10_05940 [Pseudarthrobacter sp.]